MENGSFLNLPHHVDISAQKTSSLDFIEKNDSQPQRNSLPSDVLKFNSVEALLSHNEDINARLKVALRRLAAMEDDHKKVINQYNDLQQSYSALADQMLIWGEKEKIWRDRNNQMDAELRTFKQRFPEYLKMEERLERFKRYQDRIKEVVKPYIAQLKNYAQSLHEQIHDLHRELDQKDTQNQDLQNKLNTLKEDFERKVQFYEKNQSELVHFFEKERSVLTEELNALKESHAHLEQKALQLNRSLERQDELENLVVSLRRNKEEFIQQTEEDMERLRQQNSQIKSELQMKTLKLEDSQKESLQLKDKVTQLTTQNQDLQSQIGNLRYMWTSLGEENERLKLTLATLEKLNTELSQKLAEARKDSPDKTTPLFGF